MVYNGRTQNDEWKINSLINLGMENIGHMCIYNESGKIMP